METSRINSVLLASNEKPFIAEKLKNLGERELQTSYSLRIFLDERMVVMSFKMLYSNCCCCCWLTEAMVVSVR